MIENKKMEVKSNVIVFFHGKKPENGFQLHTCIRNIGAGLYH